MHAGLKLEEKSLQMLPFVAKVLKAAGKKPKMARRSKGEKVVCIRMVTVMAFASLR